MTSALDDIEEMEPASSTASDLDEATVEAPAKAEATTDAAAASSAATDEPKDTLSVVRDVVEARKKDPAAASSAEGQEAVGQEADAKSSKKEPDDENYSDVPFHKHPRFQHLLRQTKVFKQDAERYQNVQNFLDTNGIAADEAADMLSVAALAKTNPAEAWKRVKPWVQNLLVASGEVLPEQLQQRVQAGEMSREAALELSRTHARANSFEQQREFDRQQAERRQQTEAVSQVKQAAADWVTDRQAKDPNFQAKEEPIMKEVAYLQRTEGVPNTPDGVRDQLQRAYKAVNVYLKPNPAPVPRPAARPAVKPVMGGQVAGTPRTEPKSTLDIINDVVGRRQSA